MFCIFYHLLNFPFKTVCTAEISYCRVYVLHCIWTPRNTACHLIGITSAAPVYTGIMSHVSHFRFAQCPVASTSQANIRLVLTATLNAILTADRCRC